MVAMQTKTTILKSMAAGLFAVAGIALLTASVARAGDQDFTLVNKTGIEIHSLHVAPHSSDEWGEDILGKDTLPNGKAWTSPSANMTAPIIGTCGSKMKKAIR